MDAALFFQPVGGGLNIAGVEVGPGCEELGEDSPAVVVVIGIFDEVANAETFSVEGHDIELIDGELPAQDFFRFQLFTALHNAGEGEGFLRGLRKFVEVSHDFSSFQIFFG